MASGQEDVLSAMNGVCQKFLPLIAEYEGWPPGRAEHMIASCAPEAQQIALMLCMLIQQQGLSEDQLAAKVASGEVSRLIKQLTDETRSDADPTSHLMRAIQHGQRRVPAIMKALEPHLGDDARGYAVDLASGSTFCVQNLARRWPALQVYVSDHQPEKRHALTGVDFMRWCLRQFAESPERDFEELARRDARRRKGLEDESTAVNLLDFLYRPGEPPYPDPGKDARLSGELEDRMVAVDVTAAVPWEEVAHLTGACRLVSCASLMEEVGAGSPQAWEPMLRGAATLLRPGGVLVLFDTMRYGRYLDQQTLQDSIEAHGLNLQIASHEEVQVEDGTCALVVLRRNDATESEQVSCTQGDAKASAARLRDQGNRFFGAKAAGQRDVQRAIRCYTQALDALRAAGVYDQELLSRLESNRSAGLLEVGRAEEALEAANRVIHLDPEWPKGQFRRMKALAALGREEDVIVSALKLGNLTASQAEQESPPAAVQG
mmetsp:Transcript_49729/g.144281  ORF Transcript_49729/g.144281 Transcript_49729/m.144281 type:complete len:490 (-) Transcript_49729:270-1739(-)